MQTLCLVFLSLPGRIKDYQSNKDAFDFAMTQLPEEAIGDVIISLIFALLAILCGTIILWLTWRHEKSSCTSTPTILLSTRAGDGMITSSNLPIICSRYCFAWLVHNVDHVGDDS